jgi:hypothetical protein
MDMMKTHLHKCQGRASGGDILLIRAKSKWTKCKKQRCISS